MKIRYIVSMGGAEPRQANEKAKNGNFVYYDVSEYEAVRLIDAEMAVAQNEKEYESAKANHEKLTEQRKEAREVLEVINNLDEYKNILEDKKNSYKALADEIKILQEKIKKAESSK